MFNFLSSFKVQQQKLDLIKTNLKFRNKSNTQTQSIAQVFKSGTYSFLTINSTFDHLNDGIEVNGST